ncbi:LysR family transcriptional regulator [Variovorax sp. J22G73]|uniref:LysR family transcriptional regulator n=1 Tax=unclassified Variovorax TaxID=663243 RepID=UPI002578D75F|nr:MULTISPECIES: LysR family transcriptional regulator [unclassified Variovorax]MDM0005000.1 LysR family transcriptional regulator [Variovorax sp. J22R203]MDM0098416.1 LysR family transcriptional regulator [Variovorax sp. J22G73]
MGRFDDLAAFAAVVREGSFTRAAAKLGVTQSALSQTVRTLEKRLDLKLLNRTTRSVAPTEAGETLYRTVEPRLGDIEAELATLGEMRGKPVGTVRITATEHAVRTLVWPRLLPWLAKYPEIKLEISSDNRFADIVGERFDIGIRLGDDVAKNMIAVRVAPDMRIVVVGSPAYFARHLPPSTPQDLDEHDCIGLRLPTYGGLLPWEFRQGKRAVNVHVKGRLVFNQNQLVVEAALAGHGLAWLPQDLVDEHIEAGRLVTTLNRWTITYPGYHLYYATRRASQALMLVVEALRLEKTQ